MVEHGDIECRGIGVEQYVFTAHEQGVIFGCRRHVVCLYRSDVFNDTAAGQGLMYQVAEREVVSAVIEVEIQRGGIFLERFIVGQVFEIVQSHCLYIEGRVEEAVCTVLHERVVCT